MIASHVHDAIAQVREVRQRVIDSGRFRGYSGRARAIGGTLAMAGAVIMGLSAVPRTHTAHVIGWGIVFSLAVLINLGGLLYWLFSDPEVKRDLRHLMPTVDLAPSIVVGALLTLVLIRTGQHVYLFGTWMSLFGLTNLSSRRYLPRVIWPVGLYYLVCGAVFLVWPPLTFLDPWPMGFVFFAGEWAGGAAFFLNRNPDATYGDFVAAWRNVK